MIKTKGTSAGKTGGNSPAGTTLTGTDRARVGGQMPSTSALPTMADQMPYLTAAPGVTMPNPQDSATLPMFSPSTGYHDSGAHVGAA